VTTRASRTIASSGGGEWLTVEEVSAELKISPRTSYRWRARGTGPRSKRMDRGGVRVRRSWLDEGAVGALAPWDAARPSGRLRGPDSGC